MDPMEAVRVLDIEPGRDYTPKRKTGYFWCRREGIEGSLEELEENNWWHHESMKDVVHAPEEKIILSYEVWLYIRGDMLVSVAPSNYHLPQPLTIGRKKRIKWVAEEIPKGVWAWVPKKTSYIT